MLSSTLTTNCNLLFYFKIGYFVMMMYKKVQSNFMEPFQQLVVYKH